MFLDLSLSFAKEEEEEEEEEALAVVFQTNYLQWLSISLKGLGGLEQ
jgi:hypothetical protein